MKHVHEEMQTLPVEVVDDITCNRCGGSCRLDGQCFDERPRVKAERPNCIMRNAVGFGGLIDTSVCGGYDSSELLDPIRYRFSICEKCLRELFATFKIPPELSDYMCNDEVVTWKQHEEWARATKDSLVTKARDV